MTTAPSPLRHTGTGRPSPAPRAEDIEAWLDEVRPVLFALQGGAGLPSSGQRRWLAEQARVAGEAIEALDCASLAADLAGSPCPELEWLHTRVCAALDVVHRIGSPRAVAA